MADELPELPEYVRSHWSVSEQRYYFRWEVATRLRKAGFPVPNRPLGTDVNVAIETATRELLPLLQKWRGQNGAITLEKQVPFGTMGWMADSFFKADRFNHYRPSTQRGAKQAINRGLNHVFRDERYVGIRFGDLPVSAVRCAHADALYWEIKLDPVKGNLRRTGRDVASWMQHMWKVMHRQEEEVVPAYNPFAKMSLKNESLQIEEATFGHLLAFDAAAHKLGFPNVATSVLAAWEFLIRVESIPTQLTVQDWRPPHRPDEVNIVHYKTGVRMWAPLFSNGEPLYPVLTERLDALKGARTEGILIPRDGTSDVPWASAPPPEGSLSAFYCVFRQIAEFAGLPPSIKFTSFRHGGIQEGAEAGLTQAEHLTDSAHLDPRTLQRYWRRSPKIRVAGRKKRLQHREQCWGGQQRTDRRETKRLVGRPLKRLPGKPNGRR